MKKRKLKVQLASSFMIHCLYTRTKDGVHSCCSHFNETLLWFCARTDVYQNHNFSTWNAVLWIVAINYQGSHHGADTLSHVKMSVVCHTFKASNIFSKIVVLKSGLLGRRQLS